MAPRDLTLLTSVGPLREAANLDTARRAYRPAAGVRIAAADAEVEPAEQYLRLL